MAKYEFDDKNPKSIEEYAKQLLGLIYIPINKVFVRRKARIFKPFLPKSAYFYL